MNKVFNKFLLAGNNFMSEFHIRQPGFIFWSFSQIRGERWEGAKIALPEKLSHVSYNDETWHSHTLSKQD